MGPARSAATTTSPPGRVPLTALTSWAGNVALGYNSLNAVTTATYNTVVGYQAGQNVTGANNVAIGDSALAYAAQRVTTSSLSVPRLSTTESRATTTSAWLPDRILPDQRRVQHRGRYYAGSRVSTGSNNIAIGTSALGAGSGATSSDNIAIGRTSGCPDQLAGNIAVGMNAWAASRAVRATTSASAGTPGRASRPATTT
jgi:hypothetical protein